MYFLKENKQLSISYIINEQTIYSSMPEDDTSLADLVNRKIVKSYKIEQGD